MATQSHETIGRKYDEFAPRYDRLEAIPEWLGIRRLRERAFRRARGRVLEVAIGTGRNLPLYPRPVESVVGVDLSRRMLERAAVRAAEAPFPVRLQVAVAGALPFPDATFDTVTSSLSTCTFPDSAGAVREMARVCRPEGRVLLLEHGRSSHGWLARFQDWRADSHAEMLGCRWNREPQRIVGDAGLELVAADRAFFGIFHVLEARP